MNVDYLTAKFLLDQEEDVTPYERVQEVFTCESNLSHYCSGKYIATPESPAECLLCHRKRIEMAEMVKYKEKQGDF